MGWKHFSLWSKVFPYDFPCQIINFKLYSVCHDCPELLWRLVLKVNDIFTISCHSWLSTILVTCKTELNSSLSPSHSPSLCLFSKWKRWKGKEECSISHPDLIVATRGIFALPGEEGLSSSRQSCGTARQSQAVTFSIPLEAKNANLFTAS